MSKLGYLSFKVKSSKLNILIENKSNRLVE
jgi:hypothetical protein